MPAPRQVTSGPDDLGLARTAADDDGKLKAGARSARRKVVADPGAVPVEALEELSRGGGTRKESVSTRPRAPQSGGDRGRSRARGGRGRDSSSSGGATFSTRRRSITS
ncbi:MAG: hypothetical protein WDN31_00875 [Hyphomicrobium sp.]